MFLKSSNRATKTPIWKKYINRLLAHELSTMTRFYDKTIQWLPRNEESGILLQELECPEKSLVREDQSFPDLSAESERRTAVLLNGTINHHFDIQDLLMQLAPSLSRSSRVLMVIYNPYLGWLYRLANRLGLRSGEVPTTFVTKVDLDNIAQISGYTIVRRRLAVFFPWKLFGLGDAINRFAACIPVLRWLGLVYLAVLRPNVAASEVRPSLSLVIPARNERGNIENAMKRMPDLGCDLEVIFVEGHSKDGTWEEIQRVKEQYGGRFDIKVMQQTGKGKNDAVRLGFSQARGDLLTILDADLTMPPELLLRFYQAYCDGHADFINGSRLVYPMEGEAMRFLNRLANTFFAKALSWVLDVRLGDSLCGTKLVSRHDYRRFVEWRHRFGDFDPFGDFELLFPAAELALGITDVPIRYRNRTYGSTNISRFSHGFMLLKMTLIGFLRIKLGIRARYAG